MTNRMLQPWLLLMAAMLVSGTAAAQLPRTCLDEPVFEGKLCFYEANPVSQVTVLLVHGIGGSADDWALQIPQLAQRYHVLAVDLPGFGQSDGGPQHYSPENYVAALHFLVQRRARSPLRLVGHSMGGAVALNYAALHPDRVDRLVVADVAGILHRLAYTKFLVGNWLHGGDGESRWSSEVLQSFAGKFLEGLVNSSFDSEDAMENSYVEGVGGERQISAMALVDADFTPLLPRVQAPVLILWGTADDIAPLRTAQVLRRRLPRSWLELIDGAAHVPMSDRPEVFNRLLLGFLEDALPPPPIAYEPEGDAARIGRCERQRNVRFEGRYSRIELRHCSDVTITDAEIGELYMFESRANIERSRIGGGGLAVDVIGSDVKMTAVQLHGDYALRVARSRVDLAAVDLVAQEAAVVAVSNSKAVFSLCRIDSPHLAGDLHGYRVLTPESPL